MDKPPVMIATATTGLDDEDELIAVAVLAPAWAYRAAEIRRLFVRNVDRDKLLKSEKYHCFKDQYVQEHAVADGDFTTAVAEFLDNYELFTYNPKFQADFLTRVFTETPACMLHNLPLLLKLANMHVTLETKDTATVDALETAAGKLAGNSPAFKRMCEVNAVEPLLPPALPAESAVHQLAQLWRKLGETDVNVQMTLL